MEVGSWEVRRLGGWRLEVGSWKLLVVSCLEFKMKELRI